MMFGGFVVVGFFVFVHVMAVRAGEGVCNKIEDKSALLKLKRRLFCDYDPAIRPTDKDNNATLVNVYLIPKVAVFNEFSNTLSMHSWLYISWRDPYLEWREEDFEDIETFFVTSQEIWTPDITVHNSDSGSIDGKIPYTHCNLADDGIVVCVPTIEYTTRCDTDYTYWPFDTQNCSFQFASLAHSSNELSIKEHRFIMVMDHYQPNAEWNVTFSGLRQTIGKSRFHTYEEIPTIAVDFSLQRGGSQLRRVFIVPTITLAVLTLTTLWLDAAGNERLTVAIINYFCHFKCILYIHWSIPYGGSLPNILLFYHNSLVLATLALILTCILRHFSTRDSPPPVWISSHVATILASKPGQLLLLSILDPKASARIEEDADDNSDLVGSEAPKKSTWSYVIVIIGWISFLTYLFTYFIMFIVYLRVPNSK